MLVAAALAAAKSAVRQPRRLEEQFCISESWFRNVEAETRKFTKHVIYEKVL